MNKMSLLRHLISTLVAVLIFTGFIGSQIFMGIPLFGATNISSASPDYFAWNDVIGWLDYYNTNTVNVDSYKISGYASSSAGNILMDCATTASGNICGSSPFYVFNSSGTGGFAGWGWNDIYGWISFCGVPAPSTSTPGCITSTYQYALSVSQTTGDFSGWAWNDVAGWISFNCNDPNSSGCSPVAFKVNTSWRPTSTSAGLESSTFDTGISSGAQLNSFLWKGSRPNGTEARFQFAVSNSSSGPWTYIGPDGGTSSFFSSQPDKVTVFGPSTAQSSGSYNAFKDFRYFRYRIILVSDIAQRYTPRIDDVIINWSP